MRGEPQSAFCFAGGLEQPTSCSWIVDDVTIAWWLIMLVATALVVLLCWPAALSGELSPGELHFLLLSSATGALAVAASGDLVTLLVAMETVSLPAFALVAIRRADRRGAEAALKFFVASVVATAFSLLGISLVYGATGSVLAGPVSASAATGAAATPVIGIGMVLTVVALAFKVAAVPFQVWVPDTYVGAPVPVAGYLSVVSKAAGLAGLTIVLGPLHGGVRRHLDDGRRRVGRAHHDRRQPRGAATAACRAAARLVVGRPGRIPARAARRRRHARRRDRCARLRPDVRRGEPRRVRGRGRPRKLGVSRVDECTGLARSHPWIGGSLAFALLCLAGLPPGIVGLIAKVAVFQRAVDGIGVDTTWLAVVMAVNVAIGLVYYLRFLVVLLRPVPAGQHLGATSDDTGAEQDDDWEGLDPDVPWSTEFVVGLTLAAALVLSVFPGLLFAAVSP